jgi:hypothetical protein
MKTNKLINILLSGLLVAFSLGGCTDDFKEINTNQRVLAQIDAATIGNVYASAQYNGMLYGGYSWQIAENLFSDLYVQYYSDWQTKFQTDRHNQNVDWSDAAWTTFYGGSAKDMAVVLEKTTGPGFEKQHALTQILKVYLYQRFTDYWGPIPYSQVNNNLSSVPYDSQQNIYADFIVQLDSATTTLANFHGENAFGLNDQIYSGDVDKWIIFANTLRLRVAMRLSDVDAATAKTQAEKAVAAGVMETNDQVAKLQVTDASPNPLPIMLPWNEFRMSATMESILKGFNDPRLSAYWKPAVNTGLYTGMRNGLSVPEISAPSRAYDNISTMALRWSDPTNLGKTPWEVMLPSEAWFARAEGALKGWNMGTTAKDAYNKGIEMSLKYWTNATDAEIAAYQAGMTTPQSDITVAWSADASRNLEQVMTQKWLGLFPDGWEAWAENRRTEFPTLYPVMHSDDPEVPPNALMRRIVYGPSEYNNNAAAVADAVATMLGGPDKSQTRLWWNPAK